MDSDGWRGLYSVGDGVEVAWAMLETVSVVGILPRVDKAVNGDHYGRAL